MKNLFVADSTMRVIILNFFPLSISRSMPADDKSERQARPLATMQRTVCPEAAHGVNSQEPENGGWLRGKGNACRCFALAERAAGGLAESRETKRRPLLPPSLLHSSPPPESLMPAPSSFAHNETKIRSKTGPDTEKQTFASSS